MENIRLPEDFTDRVMHRIEVRERAAARRTRAAAVAGGILGGAVIIAAAVIILRRYNIDLSSFTEGFRRIDILGPASDFLSRLSGLLHSVLTTPAGPVTGIVLAVFLLALAGLLHDRRSNHDQITSDRSYR